MSNDVSFTVLSSCFDQLTLSLIRPSHSADRQLWSETSEALVLIFGFPEEKDYNKLAEDQKKKKSKTNVAS